MLWKRDLSLFMILLSSLIKSNSYESENEIRIVYLNMIMKIKKMKTLIIT